VVGGPLQHLHPAHRAAGGAQQPFDAQMVEQVGLRSHHVADGDDGEAKAIGRAAGRVDAGRAAAAVATAQYVATDDVVAVGVERLAGADAVVPPAGVGVVGGVAAGGVGAAAEGVEDEDGVAAVSVQTAVGLVGQRHRPQRRAALQLERFVLGKGERTRAYEIDVV